MPIRKVLSASCGRTVMLSHYAAGEECRAHRHTQAQRSLLLAGSYVEDSEAGRREVQCRTLSIKPAGFEHEDEFGRAGALILSVVHEVGGEGASDYHLSVWPKSVPPRAMTVGEGGGHASTGGPCPDIKRSACNLSSAQPWLAEARQRLLDHPQVAITALARTLGKHPVHLARQFRTTFGEAPSEVRQRDRTARAIDQIVRSSRTLSDIAFDVGFADQAHMTRALKAMTGWTPADLRRVLAH
ncbi:helix-turn-helix domain-containing protein [Brevundimonas sp.]|uniref:helix-turn-helix domain-containing protein n=1 Tax=Brevundimonas sp. TaxID=1871086 RepID=UPI0035B2890C